MKKKLGTRNKKPGTARSASSDVPGDAPSLGSARALACWFGRPRPNGLLPVVWSVGTALAGGRAAPSQSSSSRRSLPQGGTGTKPDIQPSVQLQPPPRCPTSRRGGIVCTIAGDLVPHREAPSDFCFQLSDFRFSSVIPRNFLMCTSRKKAERSETQRGEGCKSCTLNIKTPLHSFFLIA
jgi:hypothetical protein